ncbi:MAG: deoxyribose-phosphate aldolase [Oscillospiraceae bacterium]
MQLNQIMSKIDNTLLKQTATTEEIFKLCDDSIRYKMATVCIPMSYVKSAKDYVKGKLPICTVIGFPLGYSTTEIKVAEARQAVELGADEVDMVINLTKLKNKEFEYIENEIREIRRAVSPEILKVIIETCFLTEEEKIKMCEIVTNAEADFIKTSTGFGTNGATLEDIKLFAKHIGPNVKIKAAGGIRSLQDAVSFIEAGASRLGTSAGVKIYEAFQSGNNEEINSTY